MSTIETGLPTLAKIKANISFLLQNRVNICFLGVKSYVPPLDFAFSWTSRVFIQEDCKSFNDTHGIFDIEQKMCLLCWYPKEVPYQ